MVHVINNLIHSFQDSVSTYNHKLVSLLKILELGDLKLNYCLYLELYANSID